MSVAYAELQSRLAAMTVDEFVEWYQDFVTRENSGAHRNAYDRGVLMGIQTALRSHGSPPTSDKINC